MHFLGLEVNDPDAPGGHDLHVGLSPSPVEVVAFELRGAGGESGEGGRGGWRHGGARGH